MCPPGGPCSGLESTRHPAEFPLWGKGFRRRVSRRGNAALGAGPRRTNSVDGMCRPVGPGRALFGHRASGRFGFNSIGAIADRGPSFAAHPACFGAQFRIATPRPPEIRPPQGPNPALRRAKQDNCRLFDFWWELSLPRITVYFAGRSTMSARAKLRSVCWDERPPPPPPPHPTHPPQDQPAGLGAKRDIRIWSLSESGLPGNAPQSAHTRRGLSRHRVCPLIANAGGRSAAVQNSLSQTAGEDPKLRTSGAGMGGEDAVLDPRAISRQRAWKSASLDAALIFPATASASVSLTAERMAGESGEWEFHQDL